MSNIFDDYDAVEVDGEELEQHGIEPSSENDVQDWDKYYAMETNKSPIDQEIQEYLRGNNEK